MFSSLNTSCSFSKNCFRFSVKAFRSAFQLSTTSSIVGTEGTIKISFWVWPATWFLFSSVNNSFSFIKNWFRFSVKASRCAFQLFTTSSIEGMDGATVNLFSIWSVTWFASTLSFTAVSLFVSINETSVTGVTETKVSSRFAVSRFGCILLSVSISTVKLFFDSIT